MPKYAKIASSSLKKVVISTTKQARTIRCARCVPKVYRVVRLVRLLVYGRRHD